MKHAERLALRSLEGPECAEDFKIEERSLGQGCGVCQEELFPWCSTGETVGFSGKYTGVAGENTEIKRPVNCHRFVINMSLCWQIEDWIAVDSRSEPQDFAGPASVAIEEGRGGCRFGASRCIVTGWLIGKAGD